MTFWLISYYYHWYILIYLYTGGKLGGTNPQALLVIIYKILWLCFFQDWNKTGIQPPTVLFLSLSVQPTANVQLSLPKLFFKYWYCHWPVIVYLWKFVSDIALLAKLGNSRTPCTEDCHSFENAVRVKQDHFKFICYSASKPFITKFNIWSPSCSCVVNSWTRAFLFFIFTPLHV